MPEETTEEVEETVIEGGEDNSTETKNEEADENANNGEDKGEDEFKDDLAEPSVRQKKTPADWVAERRGRKIEKLKQQGEKSEEEDIDDEEEEDVDEEDAKVVRRVLEKELGPVLDPILAERSRAEDDIAVNEVLTKYPELKKFEAKARRFMSHPTRKNLPVETIFAEVAGIDTMLKLGARKGMSAEDKASEGRTGGGSNVSSHNNKAEEIRNMTPEQFEQYKASIR